MFAPVVGVCCDARAQPVLGTSDLDQDVPDVLRVQETIVIEQERVRNVASEHVVEG